ncbi:hypothetical protein K439DRAFT_1632466 [Ramaria rubella]|nr:hypothetical protein K439DRAFT_1632466 [Ramaria rubella]
MSFRPCVYKFFMQDKFWCREFGTTIKRLRHALTSDLLELLVIQTLAEGQAELLQLLDPNSDTSDSKDEDVHVPQLSGVFLTLLADLHATQYLQDRIHIPKDGGQLWLTLGCYKNEHPVLF